VTGLGGAFEPAACLALVPGRSPAGFQGMGVVELGLRIPILGRFPEPIHRHRVARHLGLGAGEVLQTRLGLRVPLGRRLAVVLLGLLHVLGDTRPLLQHPSVEILGLGVALDEQGAQQQTGLLVIARCEGGLGVLQIIGHGRRGQGQGQDPLTGTRPGHSLHFPSLALPIPFKHTTFFRVRCPFSSS